MFLTTRFRDDSATQYNFVVAYKNSTGKWVTTPDILTDEKSFSEFLELEKYKTSLSVQNTYTLPIIIDTDEALKDSLLVELDEELDLDIMELSLKLDNTGEMSEVVEGLFKDNVISTEEFVTIIRKVKECFKRITSRNFKYLVVNSQSINFTVNPEKIRSAMIQYNSTSNGINVNYTKEDAGSNLMKEMKSELDELMLYVPRNIYYSSSEIFKEDLDRWCTSILNNSIPIKPYGELSFQVNSITYQELFKDFPSEYVNGNEELNELSLQENEVTFYNKLVNLITTYIESYCSNKNIKNIENYYTNWAELKELISILETYLEIAVKTNWTHCYKIPVGTSSGGGSDDGDDSDVDSSGGGSSDNSTSNAGDEEYVIPNEIKWKMENGQLNETLEDYKKIIRSLLSKSTIFAYAEAIIKLLRWGERKPSSLIINWDKSVGDGKLALDLNSFTITFTESVVRGVVSIDDRPYVLLGPILLKKDTLNVAQQPEIYDAMNVVNLETLPTCTIGLICAQRLKTNYGKNDTETVRMSCMDLGFVINEYKDGNKLITGIDFENGVFKVDEELELAKFSLNDTTEYYSSRDKIKQELKSDSIRTSRLIKSGIKLSREDYKLINLLGFVQSLAIYSRGGLDNVRLDNFINERTTLLACLNTLMPSFMKYFEEMSVEDVGNYSLEKQIEISLNNLNACFDINDLAKVNIKYTDVAPAYVMQQTSEFKEVEPANIPEITPVSIEFIMGDFQFSLVNIENKEFNCQSTLVNKKTTNFTLGEPSVTRKGLVAMKYLLTFSLDEKRLNKIYLSEEDKDSIKNYFNSLYPDKNLMLILKAINDKIQTQ